MKVQSTEVKNKPSLFNCVAKSGVVTALTSSFVIPEMPKAPVCCSVLCDDVYAGMTMKSVAIRTNALYSTKKLPKLDFSKVADKLGNVKLNDIVAKTKEKHPFIKKQGVKALGIFAAITAVNALVMYAIENISAKKADKKAK